MWHRTAWTLLHDSDVGATSLLENEPGHGLSCWPPVCPGALGVILVPGTNLVLANPWSPGQCLGSWDQCRQGALQEEEIWVP